MGDVVATRRNHRQLRTTTGDIVRNRELWTVTDIDDAGELTVTGIDGHGIVTLPAGPLTVPSSVSIRTSVCNRTKPFKRTSSSLV